MQNNEPPTQTGDDGPNGPGSSASVALREHLESVQPGASGCVTRAQLNQSKEEFMETLALLEDLDRAGALRLSRVSCGAGDSGQVERIEFERLR